MITPDMARKVEGLSDTDVLSVLNHLTATVRDTLPSEQLSVVRSVGEANTALFKLLEAPHGSLEGTPLLSGDSDTVQVGRRLLLAMLQDEATHDQAHSLIDSPPQNSDRSLEAAIQASIVLGALITWLQTKVEITVERKGGQSNFKFTIKKGATSASVVKDLVKTVRNFLSPE